DPRVSSADLYLASTTPIIVPNTTAMTKPINSLFKLFKVANIKVPSVNPVISASVTPTGPGNIVLGQICRRNTTSQTISKAPKKSNRLYSVLMTDFLLHYLRNFAFKELHNFIFQVDKFRMIYGSGPGNINMELFYNPTRTRSH